MKMPEQLLKPKGLLFFGVFSEGRIKSLAKNNFTKSSA